MTLPAFLVLPSNCLVTRRARVRNDAIVLLSAFAPRNRFFMVNCSETHFSLLGEPHCDGVDSGPVPALRAAYALHLDRHPRGDPDDLRRAYELAVAHAPRTTPVVAVCTSVDELNAARAVGVTLTVGFVPRGVHRPEVLRAADMPFIYGSTTAWWKRQLAARLAHRVRFHQDARQSA